MNIFDIDNKIKEHELKLKKLKKKRLKEIGSIISSLKPGTKFEITNPSKDSDNWHCYRFDGIEKDSDRVKYSMLNKHYNNWVKYYSEPANFFLELESFTDFKKKLEREYKLEKLGC